MQIIMETNANYSSSLKVMNISELLFVKGGKKDGGDEHKDQMPR
jgi:hypothetical protein